MPVAHVGLAGRSDAEVWAHALANDFTIVTTNARDFVTLLRVELHPGLIVLRESSLTRTEQWARLEVILDHLQTQADPIGYLTNRLVELQYPSRLLSRMIGSQTE